MTVPAQACHFSSQRGVSLAIVSRSPPDDDLGDGPAGLASCP